ncbi:endonuclease domain-containing protein [Salinimicrobium sp. MT39]|uniref:Endonuclease domain-containing protein n=1 Tax=Salinimicrobium profundisediminis TaxID=2994553 RepID=A0A9X3CWN7_9FLAO|nr:endonuclease domain-containing protein [Salinimicrobium profundisediminis]MCX2838064.1 endonuclease domain-containing protein [Salinimicrobium profundisediminis]
MESNIYDMFYGASPIIHKQARELRGKETKAEKLLWSFLCNRQLQVKFRRQHPINQYIVDFYCHELKLVIEADGGIHDRKEQKEYDHMRNEHLQKFGITLMRFRNSEIFNTTEHVVRLIKNQVDNLR